ncbi:Uncharacterised protein [Yersinia aleksiciae]|uniref:Uncharacterized protein n=1 Tax=Yersinia aleksiciae TaxID=263819 RepID=A0A0T9UG80_YERAE|nr:Uncharacterised protein [Yersinia aleksiciae]CNL39472.1 Uncharacterised protein [Yersinia aleksiciae]
MPKRVVLGAESVLVTVSLFSMTGASKAKVPFSSVAPIRALGPELVIRSRAFSVASALIREPVLNRVLVSVSSRPRVKISPRLVNAPVAVRLAWVALILPLFSKLLEWVLSLPPANSCPSLVNAPRVVKVKSRPACSVDPARLLKSFCKPRVRS